MDSGRHSNAVTSSSSARESHFSHPSTRMSRDVILEGNNGPMVKRSSRIDGALTNFKSTRVTMNAKVAGK